MSKPLDLKFLYYFSNDALCVLEVKINGLAEGTPPGQVYHWLLYKRTNQQFQKLEFKSMGSRSNRDYREFEQGELWFDTSQAHLKLQSPVEQDESIFIVHDPDTVPENLVVKVQYFLQKLRH